jgi:glycerol kinase
MSGPLLALDVGTTSVRALVFGEDGRRLARARVLAPISTPEPGRVEQDATVLHERAVIVLAQALADADVHPRDLAGLGITTQRATIVLWDARTGVPVAPLVSWQDLRGVDRAAALQAEGFAVTAQTAASKLEAALESIERGRQRFESGEILWGNIDTFLAWRLSRGEIYAMDETQACTTGYFDPFAGSWHGPLIERQGLPVERFPRLADTFAHHGFWYGAADVPIGALVADQQSAALAQRCFAIGEGKVTYGTSATVDVHTGGALRLAAGAYPLVAWRFRGERAFCLEGMVNTAGAFLDWTAHFLGLDDVVALEALARTVSGTGGVRVLPALQGLGTPHGDAARRAQFVGLSRASRSEHLARAAFEAIAARVREVEDALYAAPDLPRPATLRADGGAAQSDLLLQLQADLLGRPVERLAVLEASALGAALGAAVGLGRRDLRGADQRPVDRVFEPSISRDEADARFTSWRDAFGLAT